jgi:SsrA-binding protein
MTKIQTQRKIVCQNRKARFLYEIEETHEAGIELRGTEVKSLRQGQGSLAESFAQPKDSELFLINFHIPPYEHGNRYNADSTRPRKLLLHRREINQLIGAAARKGYTLIPLSVYFTRGKVKVELAVGKGKKAHDKRETIKRRDQEREMRRAMRGKN